jgi:hypothetical protein
MLGVLEVVFDVVTVLIDTVHAIAVRLDLQLLVLKLFLFTRLLAYDDRHLN